MRLSIRQRVWLVFYMTLAVCAGYVAFTWNRQHYVNGVRLAASFSVDGMVSSLAISRDAQVLVVGTSGTRAGPNELWGGDLVFYDLVSSKTIKTVSHDQWINSVSISPDGRTCAVACGICAGPPWTDPYPQFDPPKHLRYMAREGRLEFWDLETFTLRETRTNPHGYFTVLFSPDGSLLATVAAGSDPSQEGEVAEWDAATLELRKVIRGHWGGIGVPRSVTGYALAFGPDSKILAIAESALPGDSWEGRVRLADLVHNSGSSVRLSREPVKALAVAADKKTLVVAAGGIHLLLLAGEELEPPTKGLQMEIVHGFPDALAAAKDARLIAIGGRTSARGKGAVEVRSIPDFALRASIRFTRDYSYVECVALSDDGRLLAVGTSQGEVFIWEVDK